MGGIAAKLGSRNDRLAYFVFKREPGLGLVVGSWEDPYGVFRHQGVVDRMDVAPERMAELFCLARGLNPRTAAMAVGRKGSFKPRPFAAAIWRAATWDARRKIEKIMREKLGVSISPTDSAKTFEQVVATAWGNVGGPKTSKRIQQQQNKVAGALFVASRAVPGSAFCLTDGASLERNTGYGHVLTVPRELSILYALADGTVREDLEKILHDATRVALAYYNRYGARVRVRRAGRQRTIPCRYAAVQYMHITARPVTLDGEELDAIPVNARLGSKRDTVIDPHLHSHLIIPNLVRDETGAYRALESRYLLLARKGAEAAFEGHLAYRVMQQFGLTTIRKKDQEVGFSVKEISHELVRHFAYRSLEMQSYMQAEIDETDNPVERQKNRSVVRLITRNNKHRAGRVNLDRHWQVRGNALGLGIRRIINFVSACRSSHGKDEPISNLSADTIVALAERMHRKDLKPGIYEERLRLTSLRQFLGRNDVEEILDACDKAMEKMAYLGEVAKRRVYATLQQCRREQRVLQLAERELPANHTLANLGMSAWAVDALEPSRRWLPLAVNELLSGRALLRCLDAPAELERKLIISHLHTLLASKGCRMFRVAVGDHREPPLPGEKVITVVQALKNLKHVRIVSGNAVIVLEDAAFAKPREMDSLLRACARSKVLMIAVSDLMQGSAVKQGGLFNRLLQRKMKMGRGGVFRLPSSLPRDKDDQAIIDCVRSGQADKLWKDTGLAMKLPIVETKSEAIAAIAKQYVADFQQNPEQTQLVMAMSTLSLKKIRYAIGAICDGLGLPQPLQANFLEVNMAGNRTCDRSYVLTEGQDLLDQFLCRSRHRSGCYQVADHQSIYRWLLDQTEDDPAVTPDGARQSAHEILSLQWQRRQHNTVAADYVDEQKRLANLPVLARSRFSMTSKSFTSAEKLKLASEGLREIMRLETPFGDPGGISLRQARELLSSSQLPALPAVSSAQLHSLTKLSGAHRQKLQQRVREGSRCLAEKLQNQVSGKPETARHSLITQSHASLESPTDEGHTHAKSRIPITSAIEALGRGPISRCIRERAALGRKISTVLFR